MPLSTARIFKTTHKNNFFSLDVNQNRLNTKIVMRLFVSTFSTKNIPQTYLLLEKHLPSILRSKCFNQNNYPFKIEVLDTEIGHLFEHILLEYLCEQKRLEGVDNPVYN